MFGQLIQTEIYKYYTMVVINVSRRRQLRDMQLVLFLAVIQLQVVKLLMWINIMAVLLFRVHICLIFQRNMLVVALLPLLILMALFQVVSFLLALFSE